MRQIAGTAAVIIACVAGGWSQAYYEASGQTAVFTLAAGAKAGPSAIRTGQTPRLLLARGINVAATRSEIVITLPALQRGNADIAIYNVAGRQVYWQRGIDGNSFRLEARVFKPGIYAVRVHLHGQSYTCRFAITGKWE